MRVLSAAISLRRKIIFKTTNMTEQLDITTLIILEAWLIISRII